jgi:hypothetical protein
VSESGGGEQLAEPALSPFLESGGGPLAAALGPREPLPREGQPPGIVSTVAGATGRTSGASGSRALRTTRCETWGSYIGSDGDIYATDVWLGLFIVNC